MTSNREHEPAKVTVTFAKVVDAAGFAWIGIRFSDDTLSGEFRIDPARAPGFATQLAEGVLRAAAACEMHNTAGSLAVPDNVRTGSGLVLPPAVIRDGRVNGNGR